jgi:hypothetical protein
MNSIQATTKAIAPKSNQRRDRLFATPGGAAAVVSVGCNVFAGVLPLRRSGRQHQKAHDRAERENPLAHLSQNPDTPAMTQRNRILILAGVFVFAVGAVCSYLALLPEPRLSSGAVQVISYADISSPDRPDFWRIVILLTNTTPKR